MGHTPLTFQQFSNTDYQYLHTTTPSPLPVSEITHHYYLQYLCILGDPTRLRNHLDYMKSHLDEGVIQNTLNDQDYEGFEQQTPLQTSNIYHPDSSLPAILIEYGADPRLQKHPLDKKPSIENGIKASTHDSSDQAYLLFTTKRTNSHTTEKPTIPFVV